MKKPPTVELVQIRQITAPGYIKHWNRSVSHLTNNKECSENSLCTTPMPPSSSGMMRTGQNPISSDYDFPSTPRSHATSGWIPSSQQPSSANQPSNGGHASNQGVIDRGFEEALRVIKAREEQHPSPYGPSSRSNSRSLEQGSLQKGHQTKLPTYDGQDDIDMFLVPFERIAERYARSEVEKIDKLYESLKGKAMWSNAFAPYLWL